MRCSDIRTCRENFEVVEHDDDWRGTAKKYATILVEGHISFHFIRAEPGRLDISFRCVHQPSFELAEYRCFVMLFAVCKVFLPCICRKLRSEL